MCIVSSQDTNKTSSQRTVVSHDLFPRYSWLKENFPTGFHVVRRRSSGRNICLCGQSACESWPKIPRNHTTVGAWKSVSRLEQSRWWQRYRKIWLASPVNVGNQEDLTVANIQRPRYSLATDEETRSCYRSGLHFQVLVVRVKRGMTAPHKAAIKINIGLLCGLRSECVPELIFEVDVVSFRYILPKSRFRMVGFHDHRSGA